MTSTAPVSIRRRPVGARDALALLAALALAGAAADAQAADTSPAQLLARFAAEAGAAGQAERGRGFFTDRHGGEWACASCHGRPPLAAGKHRVTITTTIAKPAAPAKVEIAIAGGETVTLDVARTVPAAFTASESFDVGVDLGSTVSSDYYQRRPFRFNGKIQKVGVSLK